MSAQALPVDPVSSGLGSSQFLYRSAKLVVGKNLSMFHCQISKDRLQELDDIGPDQGMPGWAEN